MIDVDYYKFEDGSNPIDPYLDALDPKMRAKVFRTIGLLEQFGTSLRLPHSEHLDVLYFFFIGNKAILTNGFSKKQQKTPPGEIQLAKDRRIDYERRHTNE